MPVGHAISSDFVKLCNTIFSNVVTQDQSIENSVTTSYTS